MTEPDPTFIHALVRKSEFDTFINGGPMSKKTAEYEPKPVWSSAVPWCSDADCPAYDGKRCRIVGFIPGNICEPAVKEMAARLKQANIPLPFEE